MGINYINTSDINTGIFKGKDNFIDLAEKVYKDRISEAAEYIFANRFEKPLVLLSGPSGSGKTTSALRIAKLLLEKGINVATISMDNYFIPGEFSSLPVDSSGKPDLESPLRVDIPLFKEQLDKLVRCEAIDIPIFDFATQSRKGSVPLKREKNDIIIVEGIHALNPMVTGSASDYADCIYVSVRTRIRSTDGSILHPRKIRLLRRLNRDCLFRNRKPEAVIEMYRSVTDGEEKYIMPHKNRADFSIDTFIAYEASVYSKMLAPVIGSIRESLSLLADSESMLKVFDELTPLSGEAVPTDSIVREFIGGSSFHY